MNRSWKQYKGQTDVKMDKYLLTLMVSFEQEYAIQKLFGRHGWEYTKITDEISVNINELAKTEMHETSDVSHSSREAINDDSNKESDTVDDMNYDSSSTEQNFTGFVGVKEESYCDSDISDNIDKQAAHCQSATVHEGLRREETPSVINGISDECDVVVKKKSLVLDRDEPHVLLERLPQVQHLSKVAASPFSQEFKTFLKGPFDLDDSGFSASLGIFFCKDCCYTFPEKKYYMLHKKDGKCVFPCHICDKEYSLKEFSKYTEHLKQHSKVHEQPVNIHRCLLCPTCGKSYQTRSGLSRHIHRHNRTEKYPCKFCDKRYNTKSDLSEHMCSKHTKSKLLCPYCGGVFNHRSTLAKHKLRTCPGLQEAKNNKLQGEVCGYRTTRKDSLMMHVRATHAAQGQYKCIPCGKSYRWRSGLASHKANYHSKASE